MRNSWPLAVPNSQTKLLYLGRAFSESIQIMATCRAAQPAEGGDQLESEAAFRSSLISQLIPSGLAAKAFDGSGYRRVIGLRRSPF
jgi:hypothetical protein